MSTESDILKRLFSSGLRIRLLAHLFMHPAEEYHVRHIAGLLEESPGNVARELANLQSAGILRSREIGNQKHYSPEGSAPFLEDLRNIFLKTVGVGAQTREGLSDLPQVELAFIYGSFARGDAHASSDIDLFIVGDIRERELAPRIARLEERLRREFNYVVFPREEVEKRLGSDGDFVHEVFASTKILLIGSCDDGLLEPA
ncbi:nucleotidyltransferase domain-containing protein [Gemmatimonadota bacterium]